MTETTVILVIAVLFAGTLVRATLGFGNALVTMPVLALMIGLPAATPLVALVASVSTLTILAANWRHVHLASAWRLVAASMLGIPLGLYCLKGLPPWPMQLALGVVVFGFASYSLIQPRLPRVKDGPLAYVLGFVAGVLGGAYNTNGPPVVIYGTLRGWDPRQFRATLQGYFLPTNLLIIAGHGAAGLWTTDVLWTFLLALPTTLLAVAIGSYLNRRVPKRRFTMLVHVFLLLIGGYLMVRAVV